MSVCLYPMCWVLAVVAEKATGGAAFESTGGLMATLLVPEAVLVIFASVFLTEYLIKRPLGKLYPDFWKRRWPDALLGAVPVVIGAVLTAFTPLFTGDLVVLLVWGATLGGAAAAIGFPTARWLARKMVKKAGGDVEKVGYDEG